MCSVDKIISCEITFTPLARLDYAADVDRVLKVIENSSLAFTVGAFATVVQGSRDEVFRLIEAVYDEMENECDFILSVRISNACGCPS